MANKKAIIITSSVAVLVVAGALIAGPILNNKFGDSKNDSMSGMDHSKMNMSSSSSDSLVQKDSDDYKQYAALTGDDYDKAFIANMIVHHEGAVDMAKLALTNASRQEIKDMANDIISAQTGEITEMQQWQKQWNYPTTVDVASSPSSMSMSDHMAMMMDELKNKTGSDFDKAFLEQMIMHHQSAINMAAPGEANAKHQEVKTLTRNVVTAQTKEIKQMQTWQKEWGF